LDLELLKKSKLESNLLLKIKLITFNLVFLSSFFYGKSFKDIHLKSQTKSFGGEGQTKGICNPPFTRSKRRSKDKKIQGGIVANQRGLVFFRQRRTQHGKEIPKKLGSKEATEKTSKK